LQIDDGPNERERFGWSPALVCWSPDRMKSNNNNNNNNNKIKTFYKLKVHSEHPTDIRNKVCIESNETVTHYRKLWNKRFKYCQKKHMIKGRLIQAKRNN
jgi:hypothetical protein